MTDYEKSLSREARRARGIFYSPDWVVQHIVERVVRPGDTVLDPACGAGAFLAAAERAGGKCIGIDSDARALELARAAVPSATLIHGDALVYPIEDVDVVVGNPPYLSIDNHGLNTPELRTRYAAVYRDKTDLAYYFLARAVELSRRSLGLLISRALLEAFKADKLRAYVSQHFEIREIVDLGDIRVFPDASIGTCILILDRRPSPVRGSPAPWIIVPEPIRDLNAKIDAAGQPLGDVLLIGQGMQTGRNGVFGRLTADQMRSWSVPDALRRKRASNTDIQPGAIRDRGEYLLYLEDVEEFSDLPSEVQRHLLAHRDELMARAAVRRGDCEWWKYTWPLHRDLYDHRQILCPYLAASNRFAVNAANEFLGLTDTTVLFDNGQPEPLEYITAILNSRLLTWRYRTVGKLKALGIREYFANSVSRMPLRRATDNPLAGLAGRELDDAVYRLYDLTPAEIALVES